MRIAIIGTGKMGRGFAQALAGTHQVVVMLFVRLGPFRVLSPP